MSGTFASLVDTNLPANFTSSLSYDANDAYLNVRLGYTTPSGLNANQQAVANTRIDPADERRKSALGRISLEFFVGSLGGLLARLERGEFDLVAVGRALLQDPAWLEKVRQRRIDQIADFTPDAFATLR